MQRLRIEPRADWRQKFEAFGFSFHSADGGYWDESACYRFSAAEVDVLEAATEELHRVALAAALAGDQIVISNGNYSETITINSNVTV